MFQEGDYIVYRNTGVCRIEKIGVPESFSSTDQESLYYHLAPVRGSGLIYIPVNSNVFMRAIITKEEALRLIDSIPSVEEHPDYTKDQKTLVAHYKTLIQTHDCATLIQLIKNIRRKTKELSERGKPLGKTDQQYMKQAETFLHEELSVALDIPFEHVPAYIRQQIE